jgi:hypothetical protein
VRFGVDRFGEGRFVLIVDDFVKQRIHVDDDLYVPLDGLFQDIQLGLVHGVGLLVLGLDEVRVARQQLIVETTR